VITGTIVSVRAGRVRELSRPAWDHHEERTWHSAYGKDELEGPVHVGLLGLDGDQQADTGVHGGPEMAVLAYAAAHYRHWRAIPGLEAMGPGGFAENLTVESFDESGVCIGDVFEAGGVTLQVSSPRGPCASISRWWNEPRMVKLATESVRIGWYHRVRSAGTLERGDSYQLVDRPRPLLSVARVFRLRSGLEHDAATMRTLIECPELSPEWRRHLEALATRG
jgi:MOSC domain-containing protein YiiM